MQTSSHLQPGSLAHIHPTEGRTTSPGVQEHLRLCTCPIQIFGVVLSKLLGLMERNWRAHKRDHTTTLDKNYAFHGLQYATLALVKSVIQGETGKVDAMPVANQERTTCRPDACQEKPRPVRTNAVCFWVGVWFFPSNSNPLSNKNSNPMWEQMQIVFVSMVLRDAIADSDRCLWERDCCTASSALGQPAGPPASRAHGPQRYHRKPWPCTCATLRAAHAPGRPPSAAARNGCCTHNPFARARVEAQTNADVLNTKARRQTFGGIGSASASLSSLKSDGGICFGRLRGSDGRSFQRAAGRRVWLVQRRALGLGKRPAAAQYDQHEGYTE